MGTNKKLIKKIKTAAENTDEKVWEFPLWDEYLDQVKSNIADVKNVGAPMQAGSIAGGAFLKSFVKDDIPWCHFDIAGTAWGDKNISYQNKGTATGEVIRLVVNLLGI
jgi:leucyl aminopeptidase